MKKFLILFITLLYVAFTNAQSIITIQRGNTTIFATTLDSAIIKAQNGDYIYLPGGLIATSSSALTINKNLKIFGAGYHPDSSSATGITQITPIVYFTTGADSSLLTGVYLNQAIGFLSSLSNITITRCSFTTLDQNNSSISNIFISENIIRGNVNGGVNSNSNIVFQKNIVYDGVIFKNYSVLNNIFLRQNQFGSFINSSSNNVFENNVFINPASSFNGGGNINNTFNNNLFVLDSATLYSMNTSGTNSNNIFNQNPSNIFVNLIPNAQWTSAQNFHLKPGSAGIGKGKDGTDIGVYGTSLPFKEGGIPLNPHIRSAVIAGTTNSAGKLSISINVAAQNQ